MDHDMDVVILQVCSSCAAADMFCGASKRRLVSRTFGALLTYAWRAGAVL
jgi:hypothetical protein